MFPQDAKVWPALRGLGAELGPKVSHVGRVDADYAVVPCWEADGVLLVELVVGGGGEEDDGGLGVLGAVDRVSDGGFGVFEGEGHGDDVYTPFFDGVVDGLFCGAGGLGQWIEDRVK